MQSQTEAILLMTEMHKLCSVKDICFQMASVLKFVKTEIFFDITKLLDKKQTKTM